MTAYTSTINPNLPAANASASSSVMRAQFGAAINDINNLGSIVNTVTLTPTLESLNVTGNATVDGLSQFNDNVTVTGVVLVSDGVILTTGDLKVNAGSATIGGTALIDSSATITGNLRTANTNVIGNATVGGVLITASGHAPTSSGAAGAAGTVVWDTSYLYVCTATNTWKRIALSAF